MQNFNARVIEEIVKQSPKNDKNPVNYLTRVFSMSKETAYRRIRNQIPFSIEEVVVIAKHFNLSVDEMLDLNSCESYPLNKGLMEPADIYSNLLKDSIELMEKLAVSSQMKITAALNMIPFRVLPGKLLFKLDYCNYMYSVGKISMISTQFSDIEVPAVVDQLHDKSVACFNRLNNITCIIDNMLFTNIIKKIHYYHRLRFISKEDVEILQAELFELLDIYEGLLRTGKNSAGSGYLFYCSFFNLESNMAFFEYDNNSFLKFWVCPESPLVLKNNHQIGDIQNRWFESKMRNSMLITKTTDIYQIEILKNIYQQILELTNPDLKYEFY